MTDCASANIDRDSALASLIATLDPVAFPHDDYVSALDRAGGDVARAAEILLLGMGSSGSTSGPASAWALGSRSAGGGKQGKRKLEHFFKPAKRSSIAEEAGAVSRAWKRTSKSKCASASPDKDAGAGPDPESESVDRAASAQQWATLLKPSSSSSSTTPSTRNAPAQGPLHLNASTLPAANLPLTLLPSPLSPRDAAALYHDMIAESPAWPRNRWFLAGREVESNHQATSYALPDGGFGAGVGVPYFYNSKQYDAKPYTPLLEAAAKAVEDAVNAHLDSVPRYAWEYRGRWRANMCAANRYDGAQATVGYHSDQMTYLGPYPTIASLSLGTPRAFRLRQVDAADEAFRSSSSSSGPRTYEVTLGHNSLVLMTPGCQERYKHTVPPQRALDTFRPGWDENGDAVPPGEGKAYTTRINITFRFYRDDFHPSPGPGPYGVRSGTPICKCGIPSLLRADQKAKARSRMGKSTNGGRTARDGTVVLKDDMAYFWQCQSPGTTGQMKGCGFFKILDMRGEGRGPCVGFDEEEEEGHGGDKGGGEGRAGTAENGVNGVDNASASVSANTATAAEAPNEDGKSTMGVCDAEEERADVL